MHAVVNGMLYDYEELRGMLEGKGCRFGTRCDSELVVHLWVIYLLVGSRHTDVLIASFF